MKKPFVLTPRAEQDIGDIWDYIAVDSNDAADRVLTALEKAILRLAKTPGIGHLREDLADRRHRFLLVYSYLNVYRFETKPLQIIRVIHAARDVQSTLGLPTEESFQPGNKGTLSPSHASRENVSRRSSGKRSQADRE
jgi:plasmid stabilization system protein ParE